MKGGTSDMLIEKTIKIKILEEVWAGIEEKARNEGLTLEEYIKTLLETMLDCFKMFLAVCSVKL